MPMHRDQYHTLLNLEAAPVSGEMKDLIKRRIAPFLDSTGIAVNSLEHLMSEAYLQGMKDAVSVMRCLTE